MAAYIVVDIDVTDPGIYAAYRDLATATVGLYGGRYLARGGTVETLEGTWAPTRLVILEFPSVEKARAWVNSPEYEPARRLRHQAAISQMVVVGGVA